MEAQTKYKWQFIGSLAVVSVIAIIGFLCLSISYQNRLDKIAELQLQDGKRIEKILKSKSIDNKNLSKEIDSLSDVFIGHEERMQGLMEMEFEKLQNDFNFISLWAGLITIVFLIFSIYSIFKTDEMLKKSDKVYDEIKDKADVIDNFSKNIKKKYQAELKSLKKDSDDYIKDLSQKISLLDSRLASIDTLIKQAKSSTHDDDSVQDSSEEHATQEPIEES